MSLSTITKEELIFNDNIDEDRTSTFVKLDDYDWMNYTMSTRFVTEKLGALNVEFEYFGAVASRMMVKQTKNGVEKEYIYEFPTKIFQKHLIAYLKAHIASWDDKYAFDGEDYVLAFYNEVVEKGIETH